jgi:NAD(P)-dependent dehydrogenase (short-subunit alcohol dehydrogenase family)
MHAAVLGARNLCCAISGHLAALCWRAAAVARSQESLSGLPSGVLGLQADAADPESLRAVLARAREELGGLSLVVNAVSAARPPRSGGAFGGGPLREADVEDFGGWAAAVAEQAFVFLSEGARALEPGGTLIQMTGGSSRRAMPGRGLWSAGAQATRALVHAAALELRPEGIHAAVLIVDATIESPKTAAYTADQPRDALASMDEIARAVEYLAGQSPRAWTHELVLTPRLDNWVP